MRNNVPDDCVNLKNAPWDAGDPDDDHPFSGKAIAEIEEWGVWVAYTYAGYVEMNADGPGEHKHHFTSHVIMNVLSGVNRPHGFAAEKDVADFVSGKLSGGRGFVAVIVQDNCEFYGYLMDMVKEHALDHVLENGWDEGPDLDGDDDPEDY